MVGRKRNAPLEKNKAPMVKPQSKSLMKKNEAAPEVDCPNQNAELVPKPPSKKRGSTPKIVSPAEQLEELEPPQKKRGRPKTVSQEKHPDEPTEPPKKRGRPKLLSQPLDHSPEPKPPPKKRGRKPKSQLQEENLESPMECENSTEPCQNLPLIPIELQRRSTRLQKQRDPEEEKIQNSVESRAPRAQSVPAISTAMRVKVARNGRRPPKLEPAELQKEPQLEPEHQEEPESDKDDLQEMPILEAEPGARKPPSRKVRKGSVNVNSQRLRSDSKESAAAIRDLYSGPGALQKPMIEDRFTSTLKVRAQTLPPLSRIPELESETQCSKPSSVLFSSPPAPPIVTRLSSPECKKFEPRPADEMPKKSILKGNRGRARATGKEKNPERSRRDKMWISYRGRKFPIRPLFKDEDEHGESRTLIDDTTVEFYLQYYMVNERFDDETRARVHVFNSFFYTGLRSKIETQIKAEPQIHDYSRFFQKWFPKMDKSILHKEIIVVPVYIEKPKHWILALIHNPSAASHLSSDLDAECRVLIIDSMRGSIQYKERLQKQYEIVFKCLKFFVRCLVAARGEYAFASRFREIICQRTPRQYNLVDCGVFMLLLAEYFTVNHTDWMTWPTDALVFLKVDEHITRRLNTDAPRECLERLLKSLRIDKEPADDY